jgi:hypothetical protein
MDVIINEVVSSVRMVDGGAQLDQRQLQAIIRAVMAALEDRDGVKRRRDEETRVADDGRGGLAGSAGY